MTFLFDIYYNTIYNTSNNIKKEIPMEEKITKKIRKVGNGTGVLLDAKLLFKAELQIGDELEVKCSKNKIVFVKTGKDYEV